MVAVVEAIVAYVSVPILEYLVFVLVDGATNRDSKLFIDALRLLDEVLAL